MNFRGRISQRGRPRGTPAGLANTVATHTSERPAAFHEACTALPKHLLDRTYSQLGQTRTDLPQRRRPARRPLGGANKDTRPSRAATSEVRGAFMAQGGTRSPAVPLA